MFYCYVFYPFFSCCISYLMGYFRVESKRRDENKEVKWNSKQKIQYISSESMLGCGLFNLLEIFAGSCCMICCHRGNKFLKNSSVHSTTETWPETWPDIHGELRRQRIFLCYSVILRLTISLFASYFQSVFIAEGTRIFRFFLLKVNCN